MENESFKIGDEVWYKLPDLPGRFTVVDFVDDMVLISDGRPDCGLLVLDYDIEKVEMSYWILKR